MSSASGAKEFELPEPRYAIYFAPDPESLLARQAAAWFADETAMPYTESPRHYGFHATLKPPMSLADGASLESFRMKLQSFAATQPAIPLPPLQVALLGNFIALTLSEPSPALETLAAACVEQFDEFRLPESPAEAAKRKHPSHTPRHLELLERWGYPYVFDQWQFHMTLTSSLSDPALRQSLTERLRRHFAAALAEPLLLSDLSLFGQPSRQEPFQMMDRFPCSQP